MKLSVNTLKKYLDLPKNLDIKELSHLLTLKTVEVEGYEDKKAKYNNIVCGVIKTLSPHPDADKLTVCQVDLGNDGVRQIVCGGTNLREGQKVVVSKPGSFVVWHGEGDAVEIKESRLRGVDSYGMICAAEEVGLSDLFPPSNKEGEVEIVDISAYECKAGDEISEVLGINDSVLEIDNKSLTNRPDLYSHYGIARELSAIFRCELRKLPKLELDENMKASNIAIDSNSARRLVGLKIEGLSNKQSPDWLKNVLTSCDIRPINAVVDITNYVMIVTGQPSHAYDADKIKGNLTVRSAREGEKLTLLDGEVLTLAESDLVIADDEKAIGLAGIMGGLDSSSSDETTSILLEIANFKPLVIRKSYKKFGLRTEASIRYEKNLDTARIESAAALSIELFKEIFPNAKVIEYKDIYQENTGRNKLSVPMDFLRKRSGRDISASEAVEILEKLEFDVKLDNDTLVIEVPEFRSTGDVGIKDDILEEVTRMIGYDNFSCEKLDVSLECAINQKEVDMEKNIRLFLAKNCAFNEIFSYPWIEDNIIEALGLDENKMYSLANPPSPSSKHLRNSTLPGIVSAAASNLRFFEEFRVFELTQTFKMPDKKEGDCAFPLPKQVKELGMGIVAKNADEAFFALKGVIEALPSRVQAEKLYFEKRNKPEWADKDAWINIMFRGRIIGNLGLLSLKAMNIASIKRSYLALAEIDVDAMIPFKSRTNKFESLPVYPEVEKDLAMVVADEVKYSDIEKIVLKNADKCIFMDEYRGSQINAGKKSVMIRLIFKAKNKTLTSEEIEKKIDDILSNLKKQLNADIRS